MEVTRTPDRRFRKSWIPPFELQVNKYLGNHLSVSSIQVPFQKSIGPAEQPNSNNARTSNRPRVSD